MAISCRKFGILEPFEPKNLIFVVSGPAEGPVGENAKGSAATMFESKVVAETLNRKNAEVVKEIMAKMAAEGKLREGKDSTTAQSLAELQKLVTELKKVETQEASGQMTREEAEKAIGILSGGFEGDFKLQVDEIQLAWRQVDEKLALREALTKTSAPIFLRGGDGQGNRVQEKEVGSEFKVGRHYTVDYGYGDLTPAQAQAAENRFSLDEMVVDPHVTRIHLTNVDGPQSEVDVERHTDGLFYDVNAKKGAKHFEVFNHYGIEITARNDVAPAPAPAKEAAPLVAPAGISTVTGRPFPTEYEVDRPKSAAGLRESREEEEARGPLAPTPSGERVEAPARTEKSAEEIAADARLASFEEGEAARQAKHIDEGRNGLTRGLTQEIPEVMKKWTGHDYSEKFYDLDYGSQILGSLKTLADIDPKSNTETEMWEAIRRRTFLGDPNKVTYQEVTQAVFDRTPDGLVKREEALKERIAKGHLKPAKVEELKKELANIEKFYGAAWVFMNSINKLGARKDEKSAEAGEKITETTDIKTMEAVCNLLFNKNNEGPVIELNLLQKIFAADKGQYSVNMQLYAGQAKMSDRMQQYISDEAAWQYISQKALTHNKETGALELTEEGKAGFVKTLNDLRLRGIADASGDVELSKEVYEADKKTVKAEYKKPLTWENMKAELDDPTQKELVRRGVAVDLGEEYIREEQDEKEYMKKHPQDAVTGEAIELIRELAPEMSAAELKEVADHLHNYYLGTAGIIINNVEDEGWDVGGAFDANAAIPLNKDGSLVMHVGFKNNTISHEFEFHSGLSGQKRVGRFDLGSQAGAQASSERVGIGAGGNASVALDKYHAWNFGGTLSAGMDLSNPASLGKIFAMSVGIERNMTGVVQLKAARIGKKQKEYVDAALVNYKNLFVPDAMTEEQYKDFEQNMIAGLHQQFGDQAIDDLKHVQFLGAGFAYIPGLPYPIPYIKMGWRGKKFLTYSRPQNPVNLDYVAEERIQKTLAAKEGMRTDEVMNVHVYESGVLQHEAKDGTTTISEGGFRKDEYAAPEKREALLKGMEAQGLHLEGVVNEGHVEVKLDVFKVDGSVDLYVDPSSGIESYIGPDGGIYLNLDKSDALFVRRVDQYFPFESFGQTHRVKLYISNNPHLENKVMEGESSQHLHYTDVMGGERTKTEVVTHQENGKSSVYASREAMLVAGIAEGTALAEIQADLDARKGVREQMAQLLDQQNTGPKLSETDRAEIEAMALNLLEWDIETTFINKSTGMREPYDPAKNPEKFTKKQKDQYYRRRNYKQLSVDGNYEELTGWLIEECAKMPDGVGKPKEWWSNTKLTFFLQALTNEAAAPLKSREEGAFEEAREHNIEWNTKRVTEYLEKPGRGGLDHTEAASIARKMVVQYFDEATKNSIDDYSSSEFEKGSIVHIMVGTEGIEGYRENYWDPESHGKLLDAVDLDATAVKEAFPTLTEEEAEHFVEASMRMLSPLNYENPSELMRSELGLEVLDAADIIFSPEDGSKLVQLFSLARTGKMLSEAQVPEPYKDIYKKYVTVVKELRDNGKYEDDKVILTKDVTKTVGLYEKCVNFTVTMHEKLSIEMKVSGLGTEAAQIQVRDYLSARKSTFVVGGGAAVVYTETPELVGEKDPDPTTQGTGPRPEVGSGRPEVHPGQAGTGGESGAADLQNE